MNDAQETPEESIDGYRAVWATVRGWKEDRIRHRLTEGGCVVA
jgi:hypothetical protein